MAKPKTFHDQASQFRQCIKADNVSQSVGTEGLLDALGKIDLIANGMTEQQIIDLLLTGCKDIGITDSLCPSFCHFMFRQFSKQIKVATLRQSHFDQLLIYLLEGADKTSSNDLLVNILRALSALVFENSSNASKFYPRLSITLEAKANRCSYPLQVCRMAINCVGNICANAGPKLKPYCKNFYDILMSNLCTPYRRPIDFTDPASRKIASSSLRALQYLLYQDNTLVANSEWDIIDTIHAFIFTHVSVQSYNAVVLTSKDATLPQRLPQARPFIQHQSSTSQRLHALWRPTMYKPLEATSSDSELSDSEQSGNVSRQERDYAKIRINAMACLTAIAKTVPRFLYPSWHKFIPDTFTIFLNNHTDPEGNLISSMRSDNQPYSLFTILLYDPTVTVRIALCDTLTAIMNNSKAYLGIASAWNAKSSFESLSERLASILADFHTAIVYALNKEQKQLVLIPLLNATKTLITNCSYPRLANGLISKVYEAVATHWQQDSNSMRVSILRVMASILDTRHEISCITNDYNRFSDMLTESASGAGEEYSDLKVESWHTFASLARSNVELTLGEWESIVNLFTKAAYDPNEHVREASLKFAESIAASLDESLKSSNPLSEATQTQYLKWWTSVLESHVQRAITDESAIVRSASCDILANTPKSVYEELNDRHQKLTIALLLASPHDENATVRASSCRALGTHVLFPSLREDPLFVSDMADVVLKRMEDSTLLVRIRATWALGNLCDALVLESSKAKFDVHECLSMSTWITAIKMLTAAASDNERIRMNAVRAIGGLLRVTPEDYINDKRIVGFIGKAMESLTKNIEKGSLKTRWNACHASSNILHNTNFPIGCNSLNGIYPWTRPLFESLARSIVQCKNYKVRINACLALSTPTSRSSYGDDKMFDSMTLAVLNAWNVCDDEDVEYQDYKYKNQLKQQLASTLFHISKWTSGSLKDETERILIKEGIVNK